MPPETWKPHALGEIAEFINGRGFKPHEWADVGLPIIRIQNLNGSGEFNFFQGTYDPKIEVHHGDLLFAWSGSRGTSFGPHIWTGGKAVLNYHTWRVVVTSDEVDKSFFHYVLQHLTNQIEEEAHGAAALVHTQKNRVEKYRYIFPTVFEQQLIAKLLGAWDRGIRQLSDLIAAKLRFKQGLMQQLLTGKRRFSRFTRSHETHHTPCGEVPTDWRTTPLTRITSELKRKNDQGVARVLTASGSRGLVDQREFFNRKVAGESLDKYYLLKRGEFAYNRSLMKGYPYGATKRLDDYDSGVLSTLYLCFQLIGDECKSDFLVLLFECGILNSQLRGIARMGARAHGLLNVTADEFFEMVVPLPRVEEQHRIVDAFRVIDTELRILQAELDLLKTQKKGLMQKLLTGQVRISTTGARQ